MTLLGEVRARPHGDPRPSAPKALTDLAVDLGPTVSYDFTFSGPITNVKSFAGHRVYALVLDDSSRVDANAVRSAVESFALGVPVIILRSCTTHAALVRLRSELHRSRLIHGHTVGMGISTALGVVDIVADDHALAIELRERYGQRVRVVVGQIAAL